MSSTGVVILLLLAVSVSVSGAVLLTSEQTTNVTIAELIDGATTSQSGVGHNNNNDNNSNNNNNNNSNTHNEQEITLAQLDTNSQQKQSIIDEVTSTKETQLKKRMVIKETKYIWPDKRIPFKIFKTGFTKTQRKEIKKAIKEWKNYTCIKITKAKVTDVNYVKIKKGKDCSAVVGMKGGPQSITLTDNCSSKDLILHEIGHTIGFYHEHNRPDRDNHVEIIFPNVDKKLKKNFEKQSPENVTITGPYDYLSIMHYTQNELSKDNKLTIKTKDPAYQKLIGWVSGLSFYDIKAANLLYKCDEHCVKKRVCQEEAFVGKNCKCWCPGNGNDIVQACDSIQ